MWKSRKGISPILATLLLVVICVAAIIVTYAWIMTFLGSQTEAGGVLLDVENVSWDFDANTTSIVVRNVGTSDARLVRLYTGTSTNNLLDVSSYTSFGTAVLAVGDTLTVVLSWPNTVAATWENSETYHFKIVSQTGNPKEFSAKTPSN